jgi:hypothetical protein
MLFDRSVRRLCGHTYDMVGYHEIRKYKTSKIERQVQEVKKQLEIVRIRNIELWMRKLKCIGTNKGIYGV